MRNKIIMLAACLCLAVGASAALPKVYNTEIDPMAQIDCAVEQAAASNKNVICQVGGNWCRWCLMFADFITKNEDIARMIDDNYVYIHVNYPTDGDNQALTERLCNAGRLGYPVLVVMDPTGRVIHLQDSSFLEEGEGYNADKVMRFLKAWTPQSVKGE